MLIQLIVFWTLTSFVFGVTIGSFLNVVIWRLPRGGSLMHPASSYCPTCKRSLTAIDLIPLFSFLALGCKCRGCKQPISWRYFGVELLTGCLFASLTYFSLNNPANAIALVLFAALLVPITFIDLDFFMIPDSLNLLALIIAIGRDVWGIVQHEPGHELMWGWLPRSVLGAVVGTLIFGFVRISGWLWKRVEAMGIGDVYLARAMGALLVSVTPATGHPLRLFVMFVLLSCASGLIVGPALIFLRTRNLKEKGDSPLDVELSDSNSVIEEPEPESTFMQQLKEVGEVLWLGDLWSYLRQKIDALQGKPTESYNYEDENYVPEPTAIPFGPFLSVGFLLTVFVGEALTTLYLTRVLHWN